MADLTFNYWWCPTCKWCGSPHCPVCRTEVSRTETPDDLGKLIEVVREAVVLAYGGRCRSNEAETVTSVRAHTALDEIEQRLQGAEQHIGLRWRLEHDEWVSIEPAPPKICEELAVRIRRAGFAVEKRQVTCGPWEPVELETGDG